MTIQVILLAALLTVCVELFAKPTTGSSVAVSAAAIMEDSTTKTDPSGPYSYIGSRARGKALQTDKFPRPPNMTASRTTQPKSKY